MRGLIEDATAEEVLAVAVERHHPNLVLACSFQKEESVLIDMLLRIEPGARVFTIDTGVLFPETYETWRKIEDRYGLHVEVMDATPPNGTPWSASNCCGQRKVDALDQALAGRTPGSPASDAISRRHARRAEKVEFTSPRGGLEVQSARRLERGRGLALRARTRPPYNPLHDQGYASIGCAPCTLPGNGREGRWAGQEKTECGLHV